MSRITSLADVKPSLVKFSKSGYTYGPAGKIVYTDYEVARTPLNVMFGPFNTPFGLSAYENDPSKISININIPEESEAFTHMKVFDREMETEISRGIQTSWTPHTPGPDYVKRNYTSAMVETMYGGSMRFTVRLCQDDLTKVRPLMLVKEYQDVNDPDAGMMTRRAAYNEWQDLMELYSRNSCVYILGRLVGFVFTRNEIRPKWDAVQVIKDTTVNAIKVDSIAANDLYECPVDISFLQ